MSQFVLTPKAREDLHDIIGYIASESPLAVKRVHMRLYDEMRVLAKTPGLGHIRPGTS